MKEWVDAEARTKNKELSTKQTTNEQTKKRWIKYEVMGKLV
jgi:hypothetical protein